MPKISPSRPRGAQRPRPCQLRLLRLLHHPRAAPSLSTQCPRCRRTRRSVSSHKGTTIAVGILDTRNLPLFLSAMLEGTLSQTHLLCASLLWSVNCLRNTLGHIAHPRARCLAHGSRQGVHDRCPALRHLESSKLCGLQKTARSPASMLLRTSKSSSRATRPFSTPLPRRACGISM
jgi:hypothetical protein